MRQNQNTLMILLHQRFVYLLTEKFFHTLVASKLIVLKSKLWVDIQKYIDGIWEEPVDLGKYKRYITVNGMEFPVLDLDYEYNAYIKMGRVEKALLLKRYMNRS